MNHMQSYWDAHISAREPYKALKIQMTKEKFVKNQNRKGFWDIFNTSWITGM